MGAEISFGAGELEIRASDLRGGDVFLDEPSVTATENAIMAAVGARGTAYWNVRLMCRLSDKLDNIMPWLTSVGASVAAADADGDGFVDLYLTVSGRNDSNRLFRNKGDGTFEDVTESAGVGVGNPEGASMAAVFGGTQSLHTNALDEAIALPSEFSARIARNTQLIIQEETHIGAVVDPWAGSYMMEKLTQDMADKAWAIIEEVDAQGGMVNCVASGWAKLRIEASAAQKQARIDSDRDVIVGVNKYRLEQEDAIEFRDIDNHAVRDSQIARLKELRSGRDPRAVRAALDALTACARDEGLAPGQGNNLLHLAIDAMRVRATVGEVSDALEKAWGRHRADTQKVTGVYAAAYDSAQGWEKLKGEIAQFAKAQGRRPRVLIAKLGQDGHDRGAKVVATAFADLGFDVDIGPLFQTPEECARQAIENDVHAVGVSTLAAGHKTLVPAILQSLREQGAQEIIVFVGGVVPRQDYEFLYAAGVKGIYGPGTPIPASAKDVLEQIKSSLAQG